MSAAPAGTPAQKDRFSAAVGRLEAAERWAADAFERYPVAVAALFSLCYFAMTGYLAWRKMFWFDELFTVYLSQLDLASLWSALKQSVDFNPPLFYAITKVARSLPGPAEVTARLPQIVGFWVFCLCLFRFVSRRSSVLAGAIAMAYPLTTTVFYYAYEARPHGVVIGFCGLALICWQSVADGSKGRPVWLLGLGATLACALLTHSYGLMLFVPVAVGESVRSLKSRRIDWGVWAVMMAAFLAIAPSIMLLREVRAAFGPQFFAPSLGAVLHAYTLHIAPAPALAAIAAVMAGASIMRPRTVSLGPTAPAAHEVAALLGLAAIPLFVFAAALLTGAPMVSRYTISAVGGFACLLGIAASKRPVIGMAVLAVVLAQIASGFLDFGHGVSVTEPSSRRAVSTRHRAFLQQYEPMADADFEGLPIAVMDNLEFLPLAYYAPAGIASRIVHVMPPEITASPSEQSLKTCCGAPYRVSTFSGFLAAHREFLAYGSDEQMKVLLRPGVNARIVDIFSGKLLVRVKNEPVSQTR